MVGVHRGHHFDPVEPWLFIFNYETDAPTDLFLMTLQPNKPRPPWKSDKIGRRVSDCGSVLLNSPLYKRCGDVSAVYEILLGGKSWKVSRWRDVRSIPRRVAPPLPSPRLPFCDAYSHFMLLRTETSRPTWRGNESGLATMEIVESLQISSCKITQKIASLNALQCSRVVLPHWRKIRA